MTRRARVVLALAAAALLIVAALLLRSLGGGGLREAVEARLSAALGQPVSVGHLGMSLFPPGLTGSDVRIGDAEAEAPALDITRVRIVPRLGSLLDRAVAVERIVMDGFVVSAIRDADGAWHLPAVVPAPAAGDTAGSAIERVRITSGRLRVFDRTADGALREIAGIDDIDADVRVEQDGLRLAPITARIGGAAISGDARSDAGAVRATFSAEAIDDEALPAFIRLLGGERPEFLTLGAPASLSVTIRVERATSRLTGSGTLRAPRVGLAPLEIERFEAPFTVDGSRLAFERTSFGLYGGTHEGAVSVRIGEQPRWAADSRIRGLDAAAFLRALAGGDQGLDGTASVMSALRGRLGESLQQSAAGRLRIEMDDGVIRGFPLLASISRALRLTEQDGNDTRFERLSATFAAAAGRGATEDLVLEAGHIRLEAEGWIAADRSLSMRGVAFVSRERSDGAIASIRELARLRRDGRLELPLTISGSLDAPSFNVDVQGVVRRGLSDELRRRLGAIIRR